MSEDTTDFDDPPRRFPPEHFPGRGRGEMITDERERQEVIRDFVEDLIRATKSGDCIWYMATDGKRYRVIIDPRDLKPDSDVVRRMKEIAKELVGDYPGVAYMDAASRLVLAEKMEKK